jgi:hypothetical protein
VNQDFPGAAAVRYFDRWFGINYAVMTTVASLTTTPPGFAVGTIVYSNDGGATYRYLPIADADGYDDDIDAIRITMTGTMASIAPAGAPSFQLLILARIN